MVLNNMINFILCDDKIDFSQKLSHLITNFMFDYDEKYKVHSYEEYDKQFEDMVASEVGFKVYLLDIVTNEGSGIDAAREIREKYDDWSSVIIIITSYEEYRFEALSNRLYLLDYINKLSDYKKQVLETLERVMKHYNYRRKCLCYEYNYTYYKIDYKDIICIEKEQETKKCLVKTVYGDSIMPGSLSAAYKKLDQRFIKVHRGLIINIDKLTRYDSKTNEITFCNGTKTNLVSRDRKKELIDRVKLGK